MPELINIIGRGVTDPHIHVFNGRAYLYASHDHSPTSTKFDMRDWWVWSSDDLLTWQHEFTLKPEDTYIGAPMHGCWATDAVEKNGRYYWVFSDMKGAHDGAQIGIVESASPGGPFKDTLGGPLLRTGAAPTTVYDPCLFKEDDGNVYIIFGVWNYFIAKLADDMRSVVAAPQPLTLINPQGPYGGKTDDKASVHKYNGKYYLSWGSYYATADSLHGPYTYRGCVVDPAKIDPRFAARTWPHGPTQGRHGNYFVWKNKWYFTYCEMAFSGNRYFRDFWISPVTYETDGSIRPIEIRADSILHPDQP
jgi:hypothetical protein